ncbi:MAG: radical SAM protein [Nitrososphaerota archaeon]|jgi:radical SAM protein with 4Fe4S-binding SPASM domain|nr:radical SAM protein [Nitrososphaerota archaeon]MDG6927007.1 radical SAM protein [Nitrososphaerota archaeon]MDG6930432.1 radical SAM protein [Nitrososphaerota archaeon]MDG6931473.1 radical SAM protein [Nitrososphaerota archaeon]MDG6936422.1 radical SAM protein [Nitrososphaerota archaeon]
MNTNDLFVYDCPAYPLPHIAGKDSEFVATVYLTSRCNMNCAACYLSAGSGGPELGTDQWKHIIAALHGAGARHIYFLGGEPTLSPHLPALVKFSRELGLSPSLSTNGLAASSGIAEKLAESGIENVQVSIDAPDEIVNDALRGSGSFRMASKAAREFSKIGLPVNISMTVSDRNFDSVAAMIELADELGAVGINFIAVQSFGNAEINHLMLSYKNARAAIEQMLAYRGRLRVTANGFRFYLKANEFSKASTAVTCPAGKSYIVVGMDGKVYGCDLLMVKGIVAGNALAEDMQFIIENRFSDLEERRLARFSPCSSCRFSSSCQGGCPARALNAFNTIYAADPLCTMN